MKISLSPHDPGWPIRFQEEAGALLEALGDRIRLIEHVGSTSVPGLSAKPLIDIVITVVDSADEASYGPPLEAAGYRLRVREPDWFEHRVFRGPDDDVNLHVFTEGAEEVGRMIRFRDRLRSNQVDRLRYEAVKQALAEQEWSTVQDYADAKSDIVEEILARS